MLFSFKCGSLESLFAASTSQEPGQHRYACRTSCLPPRFELHSDTGVGMSNSKRTTTAFIKPIRAQRSCGPAKAEVMPTGWRSDCQARFCARPPLPRDTALIRHGSRCCRADARRSVPAMAKGGSSHSQPVHWDCARFILPALPRQPRALWLCLCPAGVALAQRSPARHRRAPLETPARTQFAFST